MILSGNIHFIVKYLLQVLFAVVSLPKALFVIAADFNRMPAVTFRIPVPFLCFYTGNAHTLSYENPPDEK
jgi:hypothetical protein